MTQAIDANPPARACDYSKLRKGGFLPPSYLEHKLGHPRGTEEYRLAVLTLIDSIRFERSDLAAHVRQDRDGVRIMTDLEAEHYSVRQHKIAARKLRRLHRRRASIVRTDFSSEDRALAENADRVSAAMASAVSREARALARKRVFDGDE